MKVLKFGGSSLANPKTISQVKDIVANRHKKERLLLVLSAFQGITNQLIKAGEIAASGDEAFRTDCAQIRLRHLAAIKSLFGTKPPKDLKSKVEHMLNELEEMCYGVFLVRELSDKTKDYIVSFGERMSCTIIAPYFESQGIPTRLIDSREVIKTDSFFANAAVEHKATYAAIKSALGKEKKVIVAPGFVGSDEDNRTTTLGRGGSDYSAALFAHALDAEQVEKWTDVSGMLTSDPRAVPNARVIDRLSYEEAMELSHFGAKVIYPPTIQPLLQKAIPLVIKNTFAPADKGTFIYAEGEPDHSNVKGLSSIGDIALLSLTGGGMVGVPGFSRRMFSALSYSNVNVILITQASSEHSISVAIQTEDVKRAVAALKEEFAYDLHRGRIQEVEVEKGQAIIAMVGDNMRHHTGLSGQALFTLGKNGVNIRAIAQGSSERNISVVVTEKDVRKALNSLHESFFDHETKKLHLFLAGVGNVGGTLIEQIKKQQRSLLKKHRIQLTVVGMSNSRKMLLAEEGINLKTWEADLKKGKKATPEKFVDAITKLNLRNSVLVDNTASEAVSAVYKKALTNSIAVVASNKIAASGPLKAYKDLKQKALYHNADYLYETNVGAGLPVIETLQNLIKSGDEIKEIHAVLSGSLNFVFNNFVEGQDFKAIVKQAMDEGYTEPDPRIDLSGVDVQRKILILAREAGFEMEMKDIENTPFLDKKLLSQGSVADFMKGLETEGKKMETRRAAAAKKGLKMKYVASFAKGKAKVGLQEVGKNSPFYNIEGKDNIVLFKTKRYTPQPLVIQGAGAGAEVTAMGVFGDLIRLAKR